MKIDQAINKAKNILASAGFSYRFVTEEEAEDGVGAVAGVNYTKNGIWYTAVQASEEVGLKFTRTKDGKPESDVIKTIYTANKLQEIADRRGYNLDWSVECNPC